MTPINDKWPYKFVTGVIINPIGGVITPIGGVITPIGGVITPIGGVITPIGGVITPIGGVITPIGGVITPIGGVITLLIPTGAFVCPRHTMHPPLLNHSPWFGASLHSLRHTTIHV